MTLRTVVLPIALFGTGLLTATAQKTAPPSVFSAAQAEAGQAAYEKSCGQCHTYSLRGRKGEEGEVPPAASLPDPYLKFIGPRLRVPALMGKDFVDKYGQKPLADMFTLFRGAADTTPVSELHMSDDTVVEITAYILRMNGAKPGNQALTRATSVAFNSILD
jgi:mono/diheme cytochrome c family protein